jgi:hypothetical protein
MVGRETDPSSDDVFPGPWSVETHPSDDVVSWPMFGRILVFKDEADSSDEVVRHCKAAGKLEDIQFPW